MHILPTQYVEKKLMEFEGTTFYAQIKRHSFDGFIFRVVNHSTVKHAYNHFVKQNIYIYLQHH